MAAPFFETYTFDDIIADRRQNPKFVALGRRGATGETVASKFHFIQKINNTVYSEAISEYELYRKVTNNSEISNCIKLVDYVELCIGDVLRSAPQILRDHVIKFYCNFNIVLVVVIVTEYITTTVPLASYVFKTSEELASVVCQVVNTLAIFEKFGYQHNDLHLGNILVDTEPTETSVQYGDKTLQIKIKALIFDWNLGFCLDTSTDFSHLNDYTHVGINNSFNPKLDLYFFLRSIESKNLKFDPTEFTRFHDDTGASLVLHKMSGWATALSAGAARPPAGGPADVTNGNTKTDKQTVKKNLFNIVEKIPLLQGDDLLKMVESLFTYLMSDCGSLLAEFRNLRKVAIDKCEELMKDPRSATIAGVLHRYARYNKIHMQIEEINSRIDRMPLLHVDARLEEIESLYVYLMGDGFDTLADSLKIRKVMMKKCREFMKDPRAAKISRVLQDYAIFYSVRFDDTADELAAKNVRSSLDVISSMPCSEQPAAIVSAFAYQINYCRRMLTESKLTRPWPATPIGSPTFRELQRQADEIALLSGEAEFVAIRTMFASRLSHCYEMIMSTDYLKNNINLGSNQQFRAECLALSEQGALEQIGEAPYLTFGPADSAFLVECGYGRLGLAGNRGINVVQRTAPSFLKDPSGMLSHAYFAALPWVSR